MLTVGLTGGIAAGKTHVRRRFAAAGFHTLDLDRVSRDVMAPGGAAYDEVVAAFGRALVATDGTIDRRALGHTVFGDPAARRRLEAIVHPRIRDAEAALLAAAPDGVAIVDAALLVETGTHLRFDRLVVVFCEPQEQLRRLLAREAISEAAARARIAAQMHPEEKRRFGHFVIDSSHSLVDTDVRTDAVIAALRTLLTQPASPVRIAPGRAAAVLERGSRDGPRGLTPWGVVDEIAAAGTLDLARMAALLRPAHDGPWYLAPETAAADQPPAALAVPVAVWSEGRRPGDEAFTAAAAASLARLTHRDEAAISGAVVAALAVQQILATEVASSWRRGLPAWRAAASAWAGIEPPLPVADTVLAAEAHSRDGEAAAGAPAPPSRLDRIARLLHPRAV